MLLTFRASTRLKAVAIAIPLALASAALHSAVSVFVVPWAVFVALGLGVFAFRSYELRKSSGVFTLTYRLFGVTMFVETSDEVAPFAAFQRKTKKRPSARDPWTVSFRGATRMRILPFTMNADRALAMMRILNRLPEGTVRGIVWPF
jgi:hypothetical protein